MKRIKLVRHGESAANAGQASRNHESIPLTHRGLEQAITVARSFTKAPELIVASPFSRAQATAQETSAIFPTVAIETWPIQEFTYLAPARCVDTTVAQRRDWVDAYWARAEPAFCDGEGAESFRNRSMNPTYHKVEAKVTVASLANSSMAAALRSLLPMRRAAVAPGRGAATYRALGR